tara:strand:+ start:461 stop:583 length:123 start_codon:yes stop_codon:yes gene_type:complete
MYNIYKGYSVIEAPVSALIMGVLETHHWSNTRTLGGVCSS